MSLDQIFLRVSGCTSYQKKLYLYIKKTNMWYILKQFAPGVDVWVVKLNDTDTIFEYGSMEEAEASLMGVQSLYPNTVCKVGTK